MAKASPSWKLNTFLDSLILELDRAQDTLAVKGLNRPLTYTVKDVSLELQLFPDYDGRDLRFTTAGPGETGAARLAFQLGSITDRQIRETTKAVTKDTIAIEQVEGIDEETRTTLERIGVRSVEDIARMERNNIDIERASGRAVDYGRLANVINRARRRAAPPTVTAATLSAGDAPSLSIRGDNLAMAAGLPGGAGEFPIAYLNGREIPVLSASTRELTLGVADGLVHEGPNELRVLLDPHAVMTIELQS